MTTQYLFAGFGGQGILFAGKLLAYKGLTEGLHVSWLPSYGPEMRGGTATCSVILSDEPIGAPIVLEPDVLVAMNLPSLDRFEADVAPGGRIYADSSLIERKVMRDDVKTTYIPATRLADTNGYNTLANMIMTGRILADEDAFNEETIQKALQKCVSARHMDLLEANKGAMKLGRDYHEED